MLDLITENKKYIGDRLIKIERHCGRRCHDITINTRTDEVMFRFQNSPRSIVGDQGIDPDHVIIFIRDLIQALDLKVPSRKNKLTIKHLDAAIELQNQRRDDRIKREVEGTYKI